MSQQLLPQGNSNDILTAYLVEYESIWAEVYARFDNQRQSFNYLVTLLAAIAGLLASNTVQLEPKVFFWLPLIISAFAFIFFDNELIIWGIVNYTRIHLHNKVAEVVGDENVLLLERQRFIDRRTSTIHRLLSLGRWLLFIVPDIASILYATYKTEMWWKSPYILLFAANCLVVGLLLWTVIHAIKQQSIWRAFLELKP
ncbi:hypothetical protein [Nostoc sp.]|uniref:hypothetical protein n=1 Tax=Nostoc sp. TaxID=1180 RepID=UPI002FFABD03